MKTLDKLAVLLAAAGTAIVWIIPYLSARLPVPELISTRWYLLTCAPALLLGLRYFSNFGGFGKHPAILAGIGLCAAGIAWTDSTEMGRGALVTALLLVPLPVSALVRARNYMREFLLVFSVTTVATLAAAFVLEGSLFARLLDADGTATSNENSVGIQAAMGALFLLMYPPKGSRFASIMSSSLAAALAIFAMLTSSRTAFIAMGGALLVAALKARVRFNITGIFKTVSVIAAIFTMALVLGGGSRIYQGIDQRLIQDDAQTRDTFGGRLEIWQVALEQVAANSWLAGVGTGGVDKALGAAADYAGAAQGTDGILRLSPHNTFIWWSLAFGVAGTGISLWFGFVMLRTAYRMDRSLKQWQRTTFVTFLMFAGFGGVLTQEGYFCAIAVAMICLLSPEIGTGSPTRVERSKAGGFNRYMPVESYSGGR